MATPARIDLVDLSDTGQGRLVIDFARAKAAGVKGVFHKATEATYFEDPSHDRRRGQAAAARLPFGSYHFSQPGKSSGAAQARYFLDTARPRVGDLRPMLDLERNGGLSRRQLTAWVGEFVHVIEDTLGVTPIIYTNFDLDNHFGCPRWAARYSDPMWLPNPAAPWSDWTIWQFSDGSFGTPSVVPGIGHCDINVLHSATPYQLLESLTLKPKPAPAPKPVPKPAPKPTTPPPGAGPSATPTQPAAKSPGVTDALATLDLTITRLERMVTAGRDGYVKTALDQAKNTRTTLTKAP